MILVSAVTLTSNILDKWTPQILSVFFNEGVVRFTPLQEMLNINPRTLTARLLSLEKDGIIVKSYPHPNAHCEYHLTPKGKDLLPVIKEMQRWGSKHYNP